MVNAGKLLHYSSPFVLNCFDNVYFIFVPVVLIISKQNGHNRPFHGRAWGTHNRTQKSWPLPVHSNVLLLISFFLNSFQTLNNCSTSSRRFIGLSYLLILILNGLIFFLILNIMNYSIDVKNKMAPDRSVSAFSPICNPMNCDWGKKAFGGSNRAATIVIYQLHINRLCMCVCVCVCVCPHFVCPCLYMCESGQCVCQRISLPYSQHF